MTDEFRDLGSLCLIKSIEWRLVLHIGEVLLAFCWKKVEGFQRVQYFGTNGKCQLRDIKEKIVPICIGWTWVGSTQKQESTALQAYPLIFWFVRVVVQSNHWLTFDQHPNHQTVYSCLNMTSRNLNKPGGPRFHPLSDRWILSGASAPVRHKYQSSLALKRILSSEPSEIA